MIITNKKHKKIVSDLNDKISELEKVLEEQANKLVATLKHSQISRKYIF